MAVCGTNLGLLTGGGLGFFMLHWLIPGPCAWKIARISRNKGFHYGARSNRHDRLDSLGGWGSVEGQEAGITKGTGDHLC